MLNINIMLQIRKRYNKKLTELKIKSKELRLKVTFNCTLVKSRFQDLALV